MFSLEVLGRGDSLSETSALILMGDRGERACIRLNRQSRSYELRHGERNICHVKVFDKKGMEVSKFVESEHAESESRANPQYSRILRSSLAASLAAAEAHM